MCTKYALKLLLHVFLFAIFVLAFTTPVTVASNNQFCRDLNRVLDAADSEFRSLKGKTLDDADDDDPDFVTYDGTFEMAGFDNGCTLIYQNYDDQTGLASYRCTLDVRDFSGDHSMTSLATKVRACVGNSFTEKPPEHSEMAKGRHVSDQITFEAEWKYIAVEQSITNFPSGRRNQDLSIDVTFQRQRYNDIAKRRQRSLRQEGKEEFVLRGMKMNRQELEEFVAQSKRFLGYETSVSQCTKGNRIACENMDMFEHDVAWGNWALNGKKGSEPSMGNRWTAAYSSGSRPAQSYPQKTTQTQSSPPQQESPQQHAPQQKARFECRANAETMNNWISGTTVHSQFRINSNCPHDRTCEGRVGYRVHYSWSTSDQIDPGPHDTTADGYMQWFHSAYSSRSNEAEDSINLITTCSMFPCKVYSVEITAVKCW